MQTSIVAKAPVRKAIDIRFEYQICYNRATKTRTCLVNGKVYLLQRGESSGTWYVHLPPLRKIFFVAGTMRDAIIAILRSEEIL